MPARSYPRSANDNGSPSTARARATSPCSVRSAPSATSARMPLPSRAAEYATHRGILEFQAEVVAYLSMNELGQLDDEIAAHSRGYIQYWLRNELPPDRAIQQVFRATDAVLRAGRLAVEPAE
jgi:hypothetical protein